MAHSLKMTVIAEGVETEGQLGFLRTLGCEEIQGFLFSRPLAEREFVELLKSGRSINPAPQETKIERLLLVVSNEAESFRNLGAILERQRYRLLYANTPEAGFDMMATNGVGVVLCDQSIADMSGTEFLKRIGNLYPDSIRMVMSETLEMGTMLDAINDGTIYKFLAKPWNEALVMACLRDAFRLFEISEINRDLKARLDQRDVSGLQRPLVEADNATYDWHDSMLVWGRHRKRAAGSIHLVCVAPVCGRSTPPCDPSRTGRKHCRAAAQGCGVLRREQNRAKAGGRSAVVPIR